MDWQEFEAVVRWIYEMMGKRLGVEVLCYGAKCRHLGKSGVNHQIDVLTSHSDGLHTYQTAIECKWWNEKVNKDIVMKVDSIRADCNFEKAVIVTKVGFTDDAIAYAGYTNVQLVELKEHNLRISGNNLIKVYMHLTVNHPVLEGMSMQAASSLKDKYGQHPILTATDQFLRMGKQDLDLNQLVNEFLNKEVLCLRHSDLHVFTRTFEAPTTLRSRSLKGAIPVTNIQFAGYNRRYTRLDNDYFTNRVWLALKLVFEKRQFMVTIGGEIEPWEAGEPLELSQGRHVRLEAIGNARQFTIINNIKKLGDTGG